ncbi:HET-domain-containing protein [Dothidotthia symphoricarpi CBS 119687]|uniref:HET-domain-containing protein n=1 Tax=Dothidotthia symphoricarpi CBS 119687 TaxID=1392245 RepID=A0A6A6A8L7_9PLEO|nr:HET-domain-containing protein [Dothidotthia symphoricarpi CBS 119687]KAF2127167.1 HET-domain-containing protein [Dothidotthia symphoricarpi CBS 119687]
MADMESSEKGTKEEDQEYIPSSPLEHYSAVSSPPSRRKVMSRYLRSLFLCFPFASVVRPRKHSSEQDKSKNKEKTVQTNTIESSEIRDGHKPSETSKTYKPLPYDDSIRLLRIEPGESEQDLILSLEPARLDNTLPAYEALSYVWGVEAGEQVTCNGESMKDITVNLFNALKRLRHKNKTRLVWCDALCIDQQNPTEKGLQVRKMHHIYARAEKVLVVLGLDEEGHAEGAFGVLCSLVNNKPPSQQPTLTSKNKHAKSAVYENIDSTHQIHIPAQLPRLGNPIWIKVMILFCNTWFRRMWVMQEIVLAQHAIVIWGSCSLSWDIVGRAIDCIREHTYLHAVLETRSLQNAFFMWNMCSIRRNNIKGSHDEEEENGFAFLQLLDIARSFDVTEAKDKVYGLLGFPTRDASLETGVFIRPNYTQSLAGVYADVARKLLVKEGNLDVLSFVVHPGWRENVDEQQKESVKPDTAAEDMPSWVPDWNAKETIYPLAGFGPGKAHKAGLGRPLCLDFTDHNENETALFTLRLRGQVITTIRDVGAATPFGQRHKSAPALKSLVSWYLSTARPSAEILTKTLCAHRNADGSLILDDEKNIADFMALLRDLELDLEATWPGAAATGTEMEDTKTRTGKQLAELATQKGNPDTARETLWLYSCYRAPFITESGEVGLGPGAARAGDAIVVLWGGQVPYVLRRNDDGREGWAFVGECYIEKYMTEKVMYGKREDVFELR